MFYVVIIHLLYHYILSLCPRWKENLEALIRKHKMADSHSPTFRRVSVLVEEGSSCKLLFCKLCKLAFVSVRRSKRAAAQLIDECSNLRVLSIFVFFGHLFSIFGQFCQCYCDFGVMTLVFISILWIKNFKVYDNWMMT